MSHSFLNICSMSEESRKKDRRSAELLLSMIRSLTENLRIRIFIRAFQCHIIEFRVFPMALDFALLSDSAEENFMWLLKFASIKRIKDFLAKNPSMNLHYPTKNLRTPLTEAIDRGDHQIVSLLVDKNPTHIDETITQPWNRTALMYASFASRTTEVLQLLLKKGADVHKTDTGWTCLQYAVVGERLKNAMFLLNCGALVNQRDFQERTPLMISVYLSNLDVLLLLLDRGADIDARDKQGFTALQLAILWRKRDAAIALIERGSDITVVTPLNRVPIGELCRTTMPNILRCIERKTRRLE